MSNEPNDIVTFIYYPTSNASPITNTSIVNSFTGDNNLVNRYTYWDTSEQQLEGDGYGLLPNGGISITILTDNPWIITNPPISVNGSYKELKYNTNYWGSKTGTTSNPFEIKKADLSKIFDILNGDEKIINTSYNTYNSFAECLKRIRINSKYVLKLHGTIIDNSITFNSNISIDYYNDDQNDKLYFFSSVEGFHDKKVVNYLDLGALKNFIYNDPNINETEYGGDTLSDTTDFISNYDEITSRMGGIEDNNFYIRFGDPSVSGEQHINCFPAGTMIKTEQGELPIEKVSRKNTINGYKVYCIEKSVVKKDYLVLIKKDAFGENRPNKDTLSTKWHGVYVNENDTEFIRLIDLIDNKKVLKQFVKEPTTVYNVCLKNKHSYMYANNLKVETLDPEDHLLPVYG